MGSNFGFHSVVGGVPIPPVQLKYGSFYDTTDQSATLINTGYAMQFNNTDATSTNGFVIENDLLGNPTRIKALSSGVYNLMFSAQMYRNSGGSREKVSIWLKVNDLDIPYTNTNASVQANSDFLVLAWNFFLHLDAGEYAQIFWATTSTAISIQYEPALSPAPETPSIIATINQVSN